MGDGRTTDGRRAGDGRATDGRKRRPTSGKRRATGGKGRGRNDGNKDGNNGGDGGNGGGGRGRGGWKRPYVAVWIEDITGAPVRTLCLWIEDKRWLRDLRRWTRANAEAPQLSGLVSQATRKAGAYTLAWDGKDDEGRQVIANKYTVCIEVVREHGTYQLIKREIELLQKPVELELEGNAEVAKAKLVFGKAARSVAK